MSSAQDPYAQPGDSAAGAEALSDLAPGDLVEDVDEARPASKVPKVFYRIESRNVSAREYWWGTKGPAFLLALLISKVLRISIPSSSDDPCVQSIEPFEISANELPPQIVNRFKPAVVELAALGFTNPIFHAIDDPHHKTRQYLASFSHPSLPVVARLHNRIWETPTPVKDSLFTEYMTEFADGTFLWTLSVKADFLAPPNCRVERKVGASPAQLWDLHTRWLESMLTLQAGKPVGYQTQTRELVNKLHEQVTQFHINRGVFQPLKEKDQRAADVVLQERELARQSGSKHPEVMAEIQKLQTAKVGWMSTAILLVVSIGIFFGVGMTMKSGLPWLIKIIPILLFHESGHYLAMKICGYTNLRMFFIPGFGAAVTGRHYNVAGWKKAMVSLMGPLPGIGLGVVMGLVGIVAHQQWMVETAAVAVSLNGFNLLPILPLDGGRVVQTTLTSRHYMIDTIFQIIAGGAIVVVLAWLGSGAAVFIGVSMSLGLANSIKIAKAAGELKKQRFVPTSIDNQTISVEAADRIIDQLQSQEKKPVNSKIAAQQTLAVFEALNTTPPSWLATIGLLLTHGIFFIAAVIFSILFFSRNSPGGSNFLQDAMNQPRHSISSLEVVRQPATAPASVPGTGQILEKTTTVVATLKNTSTAEKTYAEVAAKLRPTDSIARFGDTIFITIPAADTSVRAQWLDDLARKDPQVFVAGGKMHAVFRFLAIATTSEEADRIAAEVQAYSRLRWPQRFVPPWSKAPAREVTPQELKARLTLHALQFNQVYLDPAAKEMRKKIAEAARRGESTKALEAEQDKLHDELELKHLDKIAVDTTGKYDVALAREYIALKRKTKSEEFYQAALAEFEPRMGQALPLPPKPPRDPAAKKPRDPEEDDESWIPPKFAPGALVAANPFGTTSATASTTGVLVKIEYVSFVDPIQGAPALLKWLQAHQCISLKYDVSGEQSYEEEETPETTPATAVPPVPVEKK